MAVFDGNPDWDALWERLNRLLDSARTALAHLGQGISAEAARQQENWFLWLPVAMGAGICLYFALPDEPSLRWGIVALGLSAGLSWRLRTSGGWALLLILCAAAIFGFVAAQARNALVAAPVLEREIRGAEVEGSVLEASRNETGSLTLLLSPERISGLPRSSLPVRLRLRIGQRGPEIWPGDRVRVRGMFWPPATPVAPGAFDFARQAWFRQLGGTGVSFTYPEIVDRPEAPPLSARVNQVREQIARYVLDEVGGEAGAVAAALMTGQRGAISEPTEQNLRDAGLAHILAISGLHMALFAGTLFWIVRAGLSAIPGIALRLPLKKVAAIAALVGATAYLFLSGGAVATQRAYIMAVLVFGAVLVDRPALSLRNIALAAICILIYAPESVLEPGFQMSFSAATALIAVYQTREAQLTSWQANATGAWGLVKKAGVYAATLALTSLVAGLATAPFAAFHFNRTAVYGLVGNVVAMPAVGLLIMPAALVSYLLMPLGLDGPSLWVMGKGIDFVLSTSALVAGWQGAVASIPAFSADSLLLLTAGGLILALWRTRWRWSGLVFILVGGLFATQTAAPTILIGREAKLSAYLSETGELWMSGRFPTYARETWMRRNGENADSFSADRLMPCDSQGCVLEENGTRFAHAKTLGAVAEDCQWADVIVSEVPVRGALRRQCHAEIVIDLFDTARSGAIALSKTENGFVSRTTQDWTGNRPWNPRRQPSGNASSQ